MVTCGTRATRLANPADTIDTSYTDSKHKTVVHVMSP
jgi:hypothetical protein